MGSRALPITFGIRMFYLFRCRVLFASSAVQGRRWTTVFCTRRITTFVNCVEYRDVCQQRTEPLSKTVSSHNVNKMYTLIILFSKHQRSAGWILKTLQSRLKMVRNDGCLNLTTSLKGFIIYAILFSSDGQIHTLSENVLQSYNGRNGYSKKILY